MHASPRAEARDQKSVLSVAYEEVLERCVAEQAASNDEVWILRTMAAPIRGAKCVLSMMM
jgi:hypothetical protein